MYAVTFTLNLQSDGNTLQSQSEAADYAAAKTAYLPIGPGGTPWVKKKHGESFTLYGQQAAYLRKLIDSGAIPYCRYEDPYPDTLPTVTTTGLTVFSLSCTVEGAVVRPGSKAITEYGFVYAASTDSPTIDNNKKIVGNSLYTGPFDTTVQIDFDLDGLSMMNGENPVWFAAYATTELGTAYGNILQTDPNPFLCLAQGTKISLAGGGSKNIEDITYGDELLVWNFDEAKIDSARPIWIMRPFTAPEYSSVEFSNGSYLDTVADGKGHSVFNLERGEFTHSVSGDTPVGTPVYSENNTISVVGKKIISKKTTFHNVITTNHMNLFANGVLTSTTLNNLYPIRNMKFIKSGVRGAADLYDGVPDDLFAGLRLAEQAANVKEKVLRMMGRQAR